MEISTTIFLVPFFIRAECFQYNEYNQQEMELWKELMGVCPYCDPNYVDVPNLQAAMKGYDFPMGDPDRAGDSDPGVRDQIFLPMKKNDLGLMEVDGSFITVNTMIQCDTSWSENIYHTYKSYIEGKLKSSILGYETKLGEKLMIPYRPSVALPVTLNFVMPTLFSRSNFHNDDISKMKNFFTKERGSIAISQAVCHTHRVDLNQNSQLRFSESFLEAIKGLHLATNKSEIIKNNEIKRFIDEFGTHFSTSTILGVKLRAERRYSFEERSSSSEEDLKKCNTAAGVKIIGMQMDPDEIYCNDPNLMDSSFTSQEVQRFLVTTFGSFAGTNLTEWSSQIVEMIYGGIMYPAPIQRKLSPILNLLKDKGIQEMKLDDGSQIDVTSILAWTLPKLANYCQIPGIFCASYEANKCGLDDGCKKNEWCTNMNGSYICSLKKGG